MKVVVSPRVERWKVRRNFYGKWYQIRIEALREAVDIAHGAAAMGHAVDVLLMDASSETEVIWADGRDSFPPSAAMLRKKSH